MHNFIKTCCKNIEKEFVKNVLPLKYFSRGILPSEGFAFCAFCKKYNINLIIESGVYNGQSTEIWAKFFPNIPIIAIDKELKTTTIKKFISNKNIVLIKGDGRKLLIDLIKQYSKKRIAIFIDGPKGMDALVLAKICSDYKNVFVVGIHDVHKISFDKPNKRRVFLENTKEIDFYTDDVDFVNMFCYLDTQDNFKGQGDEDIYWEPNKLKAKSTGEFRLLGSYGPTVAFYIKK